MDQAQLKFFMDEAIAEAKKGLAEGGIPIGSVLVIGNQIVARGHNKRVQRGSAVLHAEMDCLENAGRLTPNDYRQAVLFSTLSPCDMCSGAVLLYKIPTVVIGAVKEIGVLVLLNRYYHQQTGSYPLGEKFNARTAPRDREQLLSLAESRFDPALMPRILGVGDTLTSSLLTPDNQAYVRGGSDRGFLELVQALGERFKRNNVVAFVDSSAGELNRPCVQREFLPKQPEQAFAGISDHHDPLQIDVAFTAGHRQYIEFFKVLAKAHSA